jgi:hypothetical protein
MARTTSRAPAPRPLGGRYPAFNRKRAPIGGNLWLAREPASCLAGQTCQRDVTSVVKRIAWSTFRFFTSRQRSRPGRIGSPAASADVQPSGRSALLSRRQVAPDPARQRLSRTRVFQVS